ncbi:MAG TPA: hypothetical protein VF316_24620 [Polyangiaceae bacterium]
MKSKLMFAVATVLLVACGGAGGAESKLSDGTYLSTESTAPLSGATLVLDLTAKTAVVTLTGASAVTLQLTAVPKAQWEKGCPTQMSSVTIETYTIAPDPAELGTLSLSTPRFVAGCGSSGANPDEVVIEGTGAPNSTSYHLAFHRR